ncbi:hypothetical protein ACH5RR_023332 [Cinchona calisaya]|uniref:Uncharacterized protein n=1 Tax=Cinchona calisaya TaxID=153742 RepID=A0ABD2ZDM9_9GENT
MKYPKFKEVQFHNWYDIFSGNPIRKFCSKLKALKAGLKEFDKEFYGSTPNKVQQLKRYLEQIQKDLQNHPYEIHLQQVEKKCMVQYAEMILAKEMLAKDKARIQWLKEGDRNTRFYHRTIKSHQTRNMILTLLDNNGGRI